MCVLKIAHELAERFEADPHEGLGLMFIAHVREHAAELAALRGILVEDVKALCDGSYAPLQGCSPEHKWQTVVGTFVALFGLEARP